MIDLSASPSLTQEEVQEASADAIEAYDPATGEEIESLNNLSQEQVRAQVDAGNAAYDASTGTELATVATVVDTVDKNVVIHDLHFHNREIWFGISASQAGNNWGIEATLNPYTVISGDNTWGVDANDAAKVIGSTDTPVVEGMLTFDFHRLFIVASSVSTRWRLRIIYGTGTMADALTAKQYSDVICRIDSANPAQSKGAPFDLIMNRVAVENQIWIQGWNATNNATLTFMVGFHEYPYN